MIKQRSFVGRQVRRKLGDSRQVGDVPAIIAALFGMVETCHRGADLAQTRPNIRQQVITMRAKARAGVMPSI